MQTKIVGPIDHREDRTPGEFVSSMQRCLQFLASEAMEAGFSQTARSLLLQEEILKEELNSVACELKGVRANRAPLKQS
jgi:hypothetical protein